MAGEEEGEEVLQQRVLPLRPHVDAACVSMSMRGCVCVCVFVWDPVTWDMVCQSRELPLAPPPTLSLSLTCDVRGLLEEGRVAGASPQVAKDAGIQRDGRAVGREDAVHQGVVVGVGVGGGLWAVWCWKKGG